MGNPNTNVNANPAKLGDYAAGYYLNVVYNLTKTFRPPISVKNPLEYYNKRDGRYQQMTANGS